MTDSKAPAAVPHHHQLPSRAHWVVEGRVLATAHPAHNVATARRVLNQLTASCRVRALVDLTEEKENPECRTALAAALASLDPAQRPEYYNHPIPDRKTISDDQLCAVADHVQQLVETLRAKGDGGVVAINCQGGAGRTGTVVGAWLLKHHHVKDASWTVVRFLVEHRRALKSRRERPAYGSLTSPQQQQLLRIFKQRKGTLAQPLTTWAFFYSHQPRAPLNRLSQWAHPTPFTLCGVQFANAEQAYMVLKTLVGHDPDRAQLLLRRNTPKVIKRLGREQAMSTDDLKTWAAARPQVLLAVSWAKFSQDKAARKQLVSTADKTGIAEASPPDDVCGIGFSAGMAKRIDPVHWGDNLLGKALLDVRQRLAANEAPTDALALVADLVKRLPTESGKKKPAAAAAVAATTKKRKLAAEEEDDADGHVVPLSASSSSSSSASSSSAAKRPRLDHPA